MVEVFGYPIHTLKRVLLTAEEIESIFMHLSNVQLITNYIDGIYVIHYHSNDADIWITDAFGEYPIFVNYKQSVITTDFKDIYDKNVLYEKLAKINYDKGYHSNRQSEEIENILPITPFRDWYIAKPCHIYVISNGVIKKYPYNFEFSTNGIGFKNIDLDFVNVFSETIINISKNSKVLIPLSAGYDSRAIYSVLYGNNVNYNRYTYGNEKKYIDSWKLDNNVFPEFDGNYKEYVDKHIFDMNGMGDIYYKCHNFYLQDNYWNDYDLLFTGDGGNEFLSKKDNSFAMVYATGDGHHYKTQCKKIKTISPYCSRLFLSLVKETGLSRKEVITEVIKTNCKKLLDYDFYSGSEMTNNEYSNFGHKFSFNTKYTYLKQYYKEMERIWGEK